MKNKKFFLIIVIVLISSACQSLTPSSVATSTPPPTQTTAPQLTATILPTEEINVEPTAFIVSEITDDFGIPMALVPEGEFMMGSEKGNPGEKPVHQVYLDAFYMDIYEVTNFAYKKCVDDGVCVPPRDTSSSTRVNYYADSEFDNYPVVNVDWNQANTYCEWRGASLPTEAQWEKAARGTDERTYPWGEGLDCTKANYWGKENGCAGDTSQVGSYENGKSPYGIYDLIGNVWEWVADWHYGPYYRGSPASNPLGPDSGESKGVRGGTWNHNELFVNSFIRMPLFPDKYNYVLGFRCVRTP